MRVIILLAKILAIHHMPTAKLKKKTPKISFAERLAKWQARPFSWSQLSSFEYDPEQWYRRYWLGEDCRSTAEMEFGKRIGEKLANDPTFLPFIKRHDTSEHPFKVMFGKIPLVGYG